MPSGGGEGLNPGLLVARCAPSPPPPPSLAVLCDPGSLHLWWVFVQKPRILPRNPGEQLNQRLAPKHQSGLQVGLQTPVGSGVPQMLP